MADDDEKYLRMILTDWLASNPPKEELQAAVELVLKFRRWSKALGQKAQAPDVATEEQAD